MTDNDAKPTSEVQRWGPTEVYEAPGLTVTGMEPDACGDWVAADDYATVERERDELRDMLAAEKAKTDYLQDEVARLRADAAKEKA